MPQSCTAPSAAAKQQSSSSSSQHTQAHIHTVTSISGLLTAAAQAAANNEYSKEILAKNKSKNSTHAPACFLCFCVCSPLLLHHTAPAARHCYNSTTAAHPPLLHPNR
jgi:hypothetical protein